MLIDTTSTPSLTESATVGMEMVFTVSLGPNTTFVVPEFVKSAAVTGVLPAAQPWDVMQVLTLEADGTVVCP